MTLVDHVAIVTGSTRGIGHSIAAHLVENGAAVVINGRNEELVRKAVKSLQRKGRVVGLTGSVESPETGAALVDLAIKEFGKVDCLINNAGIVHDSISYKMSDEEFSDVIDVHIKGTFYCSKPFIQKVKEQRTSGHIINFTSLAGLEGTVGQVNYSAAKAGINGITWTLAKELKRLNIQVNAVSPAALTDMTRPYIEQAKQIADAKGEPLPPYWEIGSPEEVARFVTTLIKKTDMRDTGKIYGVNGKDIGYWEPPSYKSL